MTSRRSSRAASAAASWSVLAGVVLACAGEVGPALHESGSLRVPADPHGSEHLNRLGVGGVVALVLVALVVGLGVLPLADHDHGSTGQVRPLVLGDRFAVAGSDVVGEPEPVRVTDLAGVEHRQTLGAEPVDLGQQDGAFLGLIAQPLRRVGERSAVLLRALELLDRLRVVLELREDRGLVERQVTGDDTGAGLLLVGHGQGGVDLLARDRGALGDLCGADADECELLDAADDLAVAHRGTVEVLDHLVGDPVGLVGLGDDLRRDVRHTDLSSDDCAPLPSDDDKLAVLVDVHGHRLQHTALLDRAGELLGVGVQVGADVRADLDLLGVQADELRVAHFRLLALVG